MTCSNTLHILLIVHPPCDNMSWFHVYNPGSGSTAWIGYMCFHVKVITGQLYCLRKDDSLEDQEKC